TQIEQFAPLHPAGEERPAAHHIAPAPPMKPLVVEITPEERQAITGIGEALKKRYRHYEDPEFIAMLHLNAYTLLPERIAKLLSRFGTDFSATQYGAIVL